MLTFLLLLIALIAFVQYLLYWIYRFATWITFWIYYIVSCSINLALDKTSRPKPPKPPLPPKPVGYQPPSRPPNRNGSRELEPNQIPNIQAPNIIVPNSVEQPQPLSTDDNNNNGQERSVNPDYTATQPLVVNGETTPKSIASTETVPKTVETHNADTKKLQKALMAREESLESVNNDICCTNLASYFVHKAKTLVHPQLGGKNKKTPPPKPPKPKPEDIERARKRISSFGEEIPGGREGFRYVDDESTESSSDYKDVIFENGRVLAINRFPKPPKCDSPEPEAVVQECDYEPLDIYIQKLEPSDDDVFENSDNIQNEITQSKSVSGDYETKNLIDNSLCEVNSDVKDLPSNTISLPDIKPGTKVVSVENISTDEVPRPEPKQTPLDSIGDDGANSECTVKASDDIFYDAENYDPVDLINDELLPDPLIHHKKMTVEEKCREFLFGNDCNNDMLGENQSDLMKSQRQSSQNYDYAVPKKSSSTKKKSPLEERHSWPVRGRKPGKVPPERPPPPRTKCMSLSVDDGKNIPEKEKPPRPPPPKSPVVLRPAATVTSASDTDPNPPPRRRSRTVEIPPETLQEVAQSISTVRRTVSYTERSNSKAGVKVTYSTIDKGHSYDKMKFRPLPPPPAPPRTHSKKIEKEIQISEGDRESVQNKVSFSNPDTDHNNVTSKTGKSNKDVLKANKGKPIRMRQPEQTQSPQSTFFCSNNANVLVDENANLPCPSQISPSTDKRDSRLRCNSDTDKSRQAPRRYASSTFYCDNLDIPDVAAHNISESPSPDMMKVRNSVNQPDGNESEVSGINADIDSSVNSSRQASVERSQSKSKKGDRSSTFYYGLDVPVQLDPKVCMEKSVQTSPDFSSCVTTDKGEDSDELMDIANNLRQELNTLFERRRTVELSDSDPISSQDDLPTPAIMRGGSSRSSEVSWQESSDESELELDGIDGAATMRSPEEKKERKIFFIANEIMTSEATFVDALRLVNVDFQNAVHKSSAERGSPVVPDEVMNHIFRYLPQLQDLNDKLLQDLRYRIDNWENSKKISDVLVKIGPFLKLYSSYIREFESVSVMLDEACRKFPHFSQLVKEFEASPSCQKLALKHFLLKPVQRIPQYRLLLEDYLRHLGPDSPDHEDTIKALQIVSEVANHANETMKQGDNFLKLVSIQNSLLTHHEIVKPGRVFLKEGELMKLSRRAAQPRWFILFNDSLLYLTPVQQGLYRINHELPLTGMRVSVPMQTDYRNEFSVISITRSFSLSAKTSEERDSWISVLQRTIEENAVKRSTFINVQMQQQGKSSFHLPDTALGKQAPVWIPDVRVTMCQLCTTEFTITYRRHHCRACGRVICWACSEHRARLHYLDFHFARVCDSCFTKLSEDSEAKSDSPSTDQRATTDSEVEAAKSAPKSSKPFPTKEQKLPAKKKYLPTVLKEHKRKARISPTTVTRVRANDQGSDISGHLFMLSRRAWKRYWFVVKDKVLYTYKASEDVAAKKSLPLLGYTVESSQVAHEGIDPSLVFILKHSGQPDIVFHAESVGFAERWVKAMQGATVL